MDEFLEQFIVESRELAAEASSSLLALEKVPGNETSLDNAFRAFHTIKGGAGIVEFDAMVHLVHGAESALAEAKSGRRLVDSALISTCLACLDQMVRWLDVVERTGSLPDAPQPQAASLSAAPASALSPVEATMSPGAPSVSSRGDGVEPMAAAHALLDAQIALLEEGSGDAVPGLVASAGRVAANILRSLENDDVAAEIDRTTRECLDSNDAEALSQLLIEQVAVLDAAQGGIGHAAANEAVASADGPSRTLRVDIGRIDALVRLTGELTTASNAIGHLARLDGSAAQSSGDPLRQRHLELDRLIGQLQRAVLGMRVLPLRPVFQRFQRLAREISAELGKPVELKIEGGDTEADKAIVEMLFEPVLHVLRNAMDHGIEEPAQRRLLDKPPIATVTIRAFREGDNVIVEVADDGKGVDVERVRAVARERGLFSNEMLDAMQENELTNIIFQPGFSTSAAVTRLSGRGVGMDAVRHAVERLGGRVAITSRANIGTTIRITLPFSAMMTRIMVVSAGGQRFGVPFDAVMETAQVSADAIAWLGTSQAVVLRDRTIPVVDLAEALHLKENCAPASDAILVIASINGQHSALRVDRIGERLDVMLNRLDGLLADTQGIAGSTVLGDGSVLLVLDLNGFFLP